MNKNVGNPDKIFRIILAIILFAVAYFEVVTGNLAIVSYVAGAIMLITGFIKTCPLYSIFGFSTCPLKK